MKIIEKDIDTLKEYENNPRINDDAVQYVANSIKEFGFKVPVVIDKDNVIVAGHTRVKACRRLRKPLKGAFFMQKIFKIFFKKVLTDIYKYGIIVTEKGGRGGQDHVRKKMDTKQNSEERVCTENGRDCGVLFRTRHNVMQGLLLHAKLSQVAGVIAEKKQADDIEVCAPVGVCLLRR